MRPFASVCAGCAARPASPASSRARSPAAAPTTTETARTPPPGPAPPASDFPATEGRTLEQVLGAASGEGPVVSPAARVLREGENRFSFGVFSVEREPITTAQVAIYAAPGGPQGPGRAGRSRPGSRTSTPSRPSEPRAPPTTPTRRQVVYVSDVPLDKPGEWAFAALIKEGDSYSASLLPTPSLVGEFDPPAVGDRAPSVSTPTADDVADISEIDTREPPSTMHDEDLADVLGKKPVVLLFATPALCQSRICGPVVDIAEQVKRDFGDQVAFIHQEVYVDNDIDKGPRPQIEGLRPAERAVAVRDRPRGRDQHRDRGRLQRRGARAERSSRCQRRLDR